jgi:hypothetical protein
MEGLAIYDVGIGAYFRPILSTLLPFSIYYGHLEYLMTNWYIFPVLVYCTKKNLAILQLYVCREFSNDGRR